MRNYNPKDWSSFIFDLRKADTLRKLFPFLLVFGTYSWLIAFLEIDLLKLTSNQHLKNVSLIQPLVGFAISMLLVFRTNTAYDRWWEGRKLLGRLISGSRMLAIKLNAILLPDDETNRSFFISMIPCFAMKLKDHLLSKEARYETDENKQAELPIFDEA